MLGPADAGAARAAREQAVVDVMRRGEELWNLPEHATEADQPFDPRARDRVAPLGPKPVGLGGLR